MVLPSLVLYRGDITALECNAIVNAANKELSVGAGVNGKIHEVAGPELQKACAALEGCGVGKAKLTKGYNLSASHIIHAVGPKWRDGTYYEKELLTEAYKSIFNIIRENKFQSVAIPNLSTGIYGFPKEKAANIALSVIKQEIQQLEGLKVLILSCYEDENFDIYFRRIFGLMPAMIDKLQYFKSEFSAIDPLVQISMYSNKRQEIRYAGVIKEFLDFMKDDFIDFDFNWMQWQFQAKEILENTSLLDKANLENLCKLLIFIVGADSRINGYLAKQIEEGTLAGTMDRIIQMTNQDYILAGGHLL